MFLLPQKLAKIVNKLADDEVTRGTKISTAKRHGFETKCYEIQLVLEVTLMPRGKSDISRMPKMLKFSKFDIYHANPLYQPNKD